MVVIKYHVHDLTEAWFGVYTAYSCDLSFHTFQEAQEYMENGIKYKIQELSIHELDKIVYEYGFYQALKLWESKKGPITNLPIDEERKFLGALVYSIVITDFCSVREWEFDTDEDEKS